MEAEDGSLQTLVIQYLLAHTQCSGCGRHYGPDDIHIRARRGDVWLAAVTCGHCGLEGLIMAAIKTGDAPGEPAPREGTMEITACARREPISCDDVLDWHCFLERFHGDMRELLGVRRGPAAP